MHLWVGPRGHGGEVVLCVAGLDMQSAAFSLDYGIHGTPLCQDQAEAKARKVLEFLDRERAARDAGQARPVTAYDKWAAEVGCVMHAGYADDSPVRSQCGACRARTAAA